MTKIITTPTRLQQGTSFENALPLINDNFENIGSAFQGFAVENQLAWPDNTGSVILAAGGIQSFRSPAIGQAWGDTMVITYPRLSAYVDPPVIYDPAITNYDNDYLFPTGAALTSGQKAFVLTSYNGKTRGTYSGDSFVSQADGKTYYLMRDVIYVMRNADTVSHLYTFTVNQSVYTSTNSFYR